MNVKCGSCGGMYERRGRRGLDGNLCTQARVVLFLSRISRAAWLPLV